MVIETEEDTIFEFLEALEVNPHQTRPKPNKSRLEEKHIAETSDSDVGIQSPRHGEGLIRNILVMFKPIGLRFRFLPELISIP